MDNDLHLGVMAQELEKIPVLRSCVITDPETGFKMVDTAELTLALTAVVAELCRLVDEK